MRQLMKMRRDKRLAANMMIYILNNSLSDCHTFASRSSAPQLINDDQASRCCFFSHDLNISHFDHKGALTTDQIICCPNPGKYTVNHRNLSLCCRYEAAHLRQNRDKRYLSHISAFSCHIGTGNKQNASFFFAQVCSVGNKRGIIHHRLYNRMSALVDY
ncbi:hypothetical protein D3C78_896410 [compost metagenome]